MFNHSDVCDIYLVHMFHPIYGTYVTRFTIVEKVGLQVLHNIDYLINIDNLFQSFKVLLATFYR